MTKWSESVENQAALWDCMSSNEMKQYQKPERSFVTGLFPLTRQLQLSLRWIHKVDPDSWFFHLIISIRSKVEHCNIDKYIQQIRNNWLQLT